MRNNSYTNWIKDGSVIKDNIKKVYDSCEQVNAKNEKLYVQAKTGRSLMVNYQIMPLRIDNRKKRYTRRNSLLANKMSNFNSLDVRQEMLDTIEGASTPSTTLSPPSTPKRKHVIPDSPTSSDGEPIHNSDPCALQSSISNSFVRSSLASTRQINADLHRRSSMSLLGLEGECDDSEVQGVVVVLENMTEGRLRQSAIERYQRRLNEMENQVKEFSTLKDKLQSLEIEDLKDIKPETSRALANIALCLNVPDAPMSGVR